MTDLMYVWPNGDSCSRERLQECLGEGREVNYQAVSATEFYNKPTTQLCEELFNENNVK